ncbi:MAG TPA: hypothetical protein VF541_11015, partial [Longimicrobium sp.]
MASNQDDAAPPRIPDNAPDPARDEPPGDDPGHLPPVDPPADDPGHVPPTEPLADDPAQLPPVEPPADDPGQVPPVNPRADNPGPVPPIEPPGNDPGQVPPVNPPGGGQVPPAGRPPVPAKNLLRNALIAAGLVLIALALTVGMTGAPDPQQRDRSSDSTVWIAQITDPHVFEEAKNGRAWAESELDNQKAFTQALEFAGSGRFTGGRVPDALVITGDFGIDSTFYGLPLRTDSLSRDREIARMVNLLRH